MMYWCLRDFLILVLLSFALVLGACSDGGDTPTPSPETTPLSVQIEAKASSVDTGGDIQLSATVDGDGAEDTTLAWSTDGDAGEFDGINGESTTWTAPSTPGTYTITVAASSGDENAQNDVQITVNSQVSLHPTSEAENNTIKTGTDVVLHAGVDNPANETIDIAWSADGDAGKDAGDFEATSGDSATWTAPTTPGTYTITVTATSGDQTKTNTVTIEVQSPLSVTASAKDNPILVSTAASLSATAAGFGADAATMVWAAARGTLSTANGDSTT